ncbi:MAG: DUF2505 domain-containing protein [Candidatus Competibacteraceae bacterium]|nr:DUF2505 domain-containing protein [Candidatus Competibacteraceae bacterium]
MDIHGEHHYDHPAAAVFKYFSDPDLIQAKFESIGTRAVEVLECAEIDGGVTQSKREVPANVPGVLKKFLGAWNKVTQTEEWGPEEDGERVCDLNVEIAGVPVTVSGTMTLRSEGQGCVNDIHIKVSCSIPLVGGKLAAFVASDTETAMNDEYDYIKSQLDAGA